MATSRDQADPQAPATAAIRVPLGALALGTTGTAVASVIALVIVATVADADALATIALALAILAFLVQIVVYIAQAWTANQQQLHAEQLNAETRALLGKIEAKADATQRTLAEHYDKLLRAVIDASSEVASAAEGHDQEPFDPEDFERRVMERVEKKIGSSMPMATGYVPSEASIMSGVPAGTSPSDLGAITAGQISGLDLGEKFTGKFRFSKGNAEPSGPDKPER